MNTLLIILAVPVYVLVGLLVVASVDIEDDGEVASSAELWACVMCWPAIVLAAISLFVLKFMIAIALLIICMLTTTNNRKDTK